MSENPPSEQELHDYIDGRLDATERARVAAYLARHPETAALVEAYRGQSAGFHALYDPVLDEPVPPAMRDLLRRRSSQVLRRRVALLAAGLAVAMVSAAAGWWLRAPGGTDLPGGAALVADAQNAHRLFAGDERWVSDLAVEPAAALARALGQKLGVPPTLPEAAPAGFSLRGVRLIPGASGTAALLVYRDAAGRAASLYIARFAANGAPHTAASGGLTTLYRAAGGLGYALTLPPAAADSAVLVTFGMQPGG